MQFVLRRIGPRTHLAKVLKSVQYSRSAPTASSTSASGIARASSRLRRGSAVKSGGSAVKSGGSGVKSISGGGADGTPERETDGEDR